MSKTFEQILRLIENGEVRISDHGYDELAEDALYARDIVEGVSDGTVVEDYPDYRKGPCVLILQEDREGQPVHVVWGIPIGKTSPAVVITAYRPEPERWSKDFLERK